jgi:hypothetical protein
MSYKQRESSPCLALREPRIGRLQERIILHVLQWAWIIRLTWLPILRTGQETSPLQAMAREFSGFVTLHPWPAKVWSATTLVAIIRIFLTKPYTPINGVMSTLHDQDACGSFIRAERHRPHSQSQGSSVIVVALMLLFCRRHLLILHRNRNTYYLS